MNNYASDLKQNYKVEFEINSQIFNYINQFVLQQHL
jgi:hypothetical protein